MNALRLLTIVCGAAVLQAAAAAKPLTIVLPRDAPPVVRKAAGEITHYVERMSNPKPIIAMQPADGDVYLGTHPAAVAHTDAGDILLSIQKEPRDPDAYVLHSVGPQLIIDGNSPRAILYGAYEYLESLGVRWYFPGQDNEIVPKRVPVTSGYNMSRVPTFRKRGVVTFSHRVIFTNHPENYEQPHFRDFVEFAARKRLNTIAVHQGYNYPEAARIIQEYGLDAQQEVHYFGEQFCPDDTASLDRETHRFETYLDNAPASMRQFFLWPDDENLPSCKSEKYRDYRISDLTLNFSNAMNKLLQARRPGSQFAFIFYLRTWEPPTHVKPDPGVMLEWAPMNQSFARALTDPASEANVRLRHDLEQYLKLFPAGTTQVLGYWLDDTLFSRTGFGNLPFRPQALQQDLRYYRSLGIHDVTTFGVFSMWDQFFSKAPPVLFLYPDLLWNVDADIKSVVDQFCRDYYGDESTVRILKDIDTLDRIVYTEGHSLKIETGQMPEFNETLQRALKEATSFMTRQTDPVLRSRAAKLLVEVASRANYRPKQ